MNAFALDGWKCEKGEIKVFTDKKKVVETSTYCFPKEMNQLMSDSCFKKDCSVFKALKKVEDDEPSAFYKHDMNPGYAVCYAIGGEPQSIDFLVGKEWKELSRCVLPGGDFMDTDWLLSLAQKSWKE